MTAIEIERLSKRFGDVAAVDDLSFTVREGTVTGFLGPNGAGKSTTLRMLLGLVTPTGGTATIDGKRYADLDAPFRHVGAILEAERSTPAGGRAITCACSPSPQDCRSAASTPCSARSTSPMRGTAGSRGSRSACVSGSA